MNNEVTCKHCSESLSPQAKHCPKCGHPQGWAAQPMGFTWRVYIVSLVISGVVVFGFLGFGSFIVSWLVTMGLALLLAYAWNGISKK